MTVFKNFGTKNDLIRESIIRYFQELASVIEKLLGSEKNYRDKLFELFDIKSRSIQAYGGELTEWLRTESPEIRSEILELRRTAIENTAVPFIEAGRRAGEIEDSVSNETLLVYFDVLGVGMVYSPAYLEYERMEPSAFSKLQQVALGALLKK